MAQSSLPQHPRGSFAIVGSEKLTVRGDGETVTITAPGGFVLSLLNEQAMVLGRLLFEQVAVES